MVTGQTLADPYLSATPAVASTLPKDVLVFERVATGFSLIGGTGRGATWAGLVEVSDAEDSLVCRAWSTGVPARLSGRKPQHTVGPYYARHAVAVAVGDRHVVVVGSDRALPMTDADVTRLAVATVDRTQGVPADKLLADELELVHTLRALMAYRPENVRDTLRHVATVAAGALSCEIAVIRVEQDGNQVVESIGLDPESLSALEDGSGSDPLWADMPDAPRVQQVAASDLPGADIVSSFSLPIGSQPALGMLALAHATARPRGFTSLCQRIGRAVAEAAELLITQATAREALASERDRLARASQIDAMTGLANRRAWDEEAQRLASAGVARGHVVTCDLDELKQTNDRFGHPAGDELIRGAAAVLLASVRSTDLVARIGGDEFAVLLRDADSATTRRIRDRLRRAERRWGTDDRNLVLRLSMGVAPMCAGDLASARLEADRRMYANKRRRLAEGKRTASPA